MKTVVVLAERLDNTTHGTLAEALEFCIEGNVWLDASGVEFLGGRCLELLVSASRTVAANGGTFGLLDPSERFLEHLGLLGASEAVLERNGGTA